MNSWVNLVPLGQLGEIVSGATPQTGVKKYWNGDIPWITPADLTNHSGIYFAGKLRKITKSGYDSCSARLLPEKSILFSSRAPIGHIAITTYPLCTNQGFKSIIPGKQLDPVFGFFAIKHVTPKIMSMGRGATFLEITKDILENICIPLPPLAEQRRIAAILTKADRLRRLRRYALELSAGYLQAVFVEMFGDPLRNPKDFPLTEFGDICETRLGKMLDAKQQTGLYKRLYLRNENVQWGRFDLTKVFEMDFDEEDRAEFRLRKGDVLICEGGEVGRSAIWKDELPECYYQKALHRVRPKPKLANSEFIFGLMLCLAKFGGLGDFTSQVTIAHLTGEKLKTIVFPLPPLQLQQQFAEVVHKLERLRVQQEEAARQAEHLFQTLLQRAFRGELSDEAESSERLSGEQFDAETQRDRDAEKRTGTEIDPLQGVPMQERLALE